MTNQLQDRFETLVSSIGNIARIARILGYTRKTIDLKMSGDSPVYPRDVYALEYVCSRCQIDVPAPRVEMQLLREGLTVYETVQYIRAADPVDTSNQTESES